MKRSYLLGLILVLGLTLVVGKSERDFTVPDSGQLLTLDQRADVLTTTRAHPTLSLNNAPSQMAGAHSSGERADSNDRDQRIAQAQDQLNQVQDQIQTSGLDGEIQSLQQTIQGLEAQRRSQQLNSQPEVQSQAIWATQEDLASQQRIANLQQQIQAQQQVENGIAQQLRTTIAPDDSDVMVQLNQELALAHQKTSDLQQKYQAAIQDQQQLALNRYSRQAEQQAGQKAAAMETDLALQQAKDRLSLLQAQKQQLSDDLQQKQKALTDLQSQGASQ